MKAKKQTKTEQVLIAMKVLSWIAFIGFMIKTGSLLVTSVMSYFYPQTSTDLYEGLNLNQLQSENVIFYTLVVAIVILISGMQAYIWYLVINLIGRIKLENPFTREIAHRLEYISYSLFAIWVLSVTGGGFIAWLDELAGKLNDSWDHGHFLFMAGLVFIISQIFKRGVEIQSENELTV